MSTRKIGQDQKPKAPTAHRTAFSHLAGSSTFAGFGAHLDPRDSVCLCVSVPRGKDVALRSVCENEAPVQLGGKVLPLLAGRLDHEEAVLFFAFFVDGNLPQDLLDAGGGLFVRKLAEREGVQRDFDACAPSGLHVWVEECLAEALVGAVGVVCKMAANGFADLPCLEVRHVFVVDFCASGPPFWRGGDPGADVLPNAVCVFQDSWPFPADSCAEICRRSETKIGHKCFAV